MSRRRILLICPWLYYSASSHADTAASAWSCEKGVGDKEWSCVSSAKPAESKPAAETPAATPSAQKPQETQALPETTAAKPHGVPRVVRQPILPLPSVALKPPEAQNKQEGWTCNANKEEATWDCSLVGTDPKGLAKPVGEEVRHLGFLTPTFNLEQEQIFTRLKDAFPYDPWQYCTAPWAERKTPPSVAGLREQSPLNVRADYGETFDQEVSNFLGNVDITRGDQHLQADTADYDSVSQVMDAQGHVMYSEEQFSLFSRSAQLQLGNDKARVRDAMFVVPSVPLRGTARNIYRDSKNFSRYDDVTYTSCRPGNQDWIVHGKQLKMNRETGKASIKNAWLEFKGVPVMYLPYMSFPVDNRRLTGFLSPSFGNTKKNGLDLNVPFYWNIAPNMDLLAWGRYLQTRGPLVGGKFRYLTPIMNGDMSAEILPHDEVTGKARWQGTFKNFSRLSDHWTSTTLVNQVSDNKYYEDLSSPLRITTSSFVESSTALAYSGQNVHFNSLWDYFQNIDPAQPSTASPYRRLPQVELNLTKSLETLPIDLGVKNEYVYFQHPTRFDVGSRINVAPYASFPIIDSAGMFLRPKFTVNQTQYVLDNRGAGLPDSISRTVPVASVDSGLIFDRELNLGGSSYVQTIEPRLFYLYIPYVNQNDLPLFDTALYDTNFNQLFFENRFSGKDRIGDANQVSAAITTRLLQGRSGTELLSFSLGEIFYFQDRRVNLPLRNTDPSSPNYNTYLGYPQTGIYVPGPVETGNYSNIISQLNGQLTDHISFLTGLQWSPKKSQIDRGNATFRYRDESNNVFNAGYRYRLDNTDPNSNRTLIHLTDFSASVPIPFLEDWKAIGRWQYSLLDGTTLERFFGLEKESCCWRLRFIYRNYLNSVNTANNVIDMQSAYFIQFELKGLGSFGQDMDDFMQRSIFGYRNPNR